MTEKTYKTTATYQLEQNGYVTKHSGELVLTLPGDAIQAGQIALDRLALSKDKYL